MPVRRILHIAPTPFFSDRGCHIRIRGIVRALNGLQHANLLCTYPIGRNDPDVDTVRTLAIPGYRKTTAGPSIFKLIADPLLVFTAARQIRRFQPDILHCHLHEGVLVGWLAKYLALRPSLKICFDVQGGLGSELSSYGHLGTTVSQSIVRWIEKFVLRRASAFFCSSKASVALLQDEFGINSTQLLHVPDGSDLDVDDFDEDKLATAGIPVAIYTGGLTKSKGLEDLQSIIKRSNERRLSVNFLVVGYPTDPLSTFLDDHRLDNCKLQGRIPFEELPTFLARASLCLEPKSGETSEASGKLLNYMASGLPIVCFDTANNRDILGEHAFFAKSQDVDAFVDQIERVLSDLNDARRIGKRARLRVIESFSWKASAENISHAYDKLLNGEA